MSSLSVLVITLNEEDNISECLESVKWADEIIVVDSLSTDRTVELARQFTPRVYRREWSGYAGQKNFALQQATSEWVLWLDADERVTGALALEIARVIASNPIENGFEIARKAIFLGRWIRHCGWYPGYVLRLFRRGTASFNTAPVHEGLEMVGSRARLRHALLHYTDRSLEHYMWKFNRYTTLAAQEKVDAGKSAGIGAILIRPWFTFFKMFIFKLGFLDGIQGFMLCLLSTGYVTIKYAKIWEKTNTPAKSELGTLFSSSYGGDKKL